MLMRDFLLKLNCHFLDSEKEQCKPLIHKLVELSNLARSKGLLALEIEIEQDLFLKTAISLVIDGTDPELIKQILQNLILADRYSGFELLSRLLIAEGILAIQQGENPRIIALKLYSMLGEKHLFMADDTLSSAHEKLPAVHQFLRSIKDNPALAESAQFEKVVLQIHDRSIQVVLYSENENTIVTALHGCGIAVIQKVLANISVNIGLSIAENWETMKPSRKESIIFCQEEILKKIETLRSEGRIIA